LADEPGRLADHNENARAAQKLRDFDLLETTGRLCHHRSAPLLRRTIHETRQEIRMRKAVLVLLALLSLPILLFVYQPSLQLGFWAFVLGNIGRTLSPLILFGALAYVISKEWNK
jgi:hypothetical protein